MAPKASWPGIVGVLKFAYDIWGDTVNVAVTVEADKPIGYFSAVRTVSFDVPEGSRAGEFEVMVGFDNKAAGAG